MAVSVGFGLYVNYEAQGIEVTFTDTLMAMIPHYCFWVLVSPALYRALHRTIQGPRRVLWASTLVAWSAIALDRLDRDVLLQLHRAPRPAADLRAAVRHLFPAAGRVPRSGP